MWFFHLVLYDLSLTVPCLKAIKLNRNYVLKHGSTLPEYLWLGSSGYILAGREGAVVDMASRQTHSSVLTTINTCALTSLCISHDVFDPEKKRIKAIDMAILRKTWWLQHITNESPDWPRLAWPCLFLPSTSKDKSQKNFRFIFQECSQTTHSRSALLLSHLQTNVDQCLRFGLCNFFYWRCIIFCLLVFYAILFLSLTGGQCWCSVVFCPLLLATYLKVKPCPVAAYHCIIIVFCVIVWLV